jgi:hypothetical protein
VYFEENEELLDGKDWIGCDNPKCNKWNHIECEVLVNNNEALKNIGDDQLYFCQTCSKNKKFGGKSTGGKGTVSKAQKHLQGEDERSSEHDSQDHEII